MSTSTVVAVVIFTVGVAVTFVGYRMRARVGGLAVMAVGALIALATARPEEGVPLGVVALAIVTLVAMLAVAAWIARVIAADPGDGDSLDEGRP